MKCSYCSEDVCLSHDTDPLTSAPLDHFHQIPLFFHAALWIHFLCVVISSFLRAHCESIRHQIYFRLYQSSPNTYFPLIPVRAVFNDNLLRFTAGLLSREINIYFIAWIYSPTTITGWITCAFHLIDLKGVTFFRCDTAVHLHYYYRLVVLTYYTRHCLFFFFYKQMHLHYINDLLIKKCHFWN